MKNSEKIDLNNYKILKYRYPYSTEDIRKLVWEKLSKSDKEFALQITIDGVGESNDSKKGSWDLVLTNPEVENRITNILTKHGIPHEIDDYTEFLGVIEKPEFSENFINDLDEFLYSNLTIDDILDKILEVGITNLNIFEKYFLDKNK